jgi:hypothetical protein
VTLVLSQYERVLIFRSRLEAELSNAGKGPLSRAAALDAACRMFATFDVDTSLSHIPTAALVVELKSRRARAEAGASNGA